MISYLFIKSAIFFKIIIKKKCGFKLIHSIAFLNLWEISCCFLHLKKSTLQQFLQINMMEVIAVISALRRSTVSFSPTLEKKNVFLLTDFNLAKKSANDYD